MSVQPRTDSLRACRAGLLGSLNLAGSIIIPGRLVHTARRLHLRLPANWPWADAFLTALSGINALPQRS